MSAPASARLPRSAADWERRYAPARSQSPGRSQPHRNRISNLDHRSETAAAARHTPGFAQLQRNPKRIMVTSHVVVKNSTPVVASDENAVESAKGERGHGEEIHRGNGLAMVAQECQPALSRVGRSWCSPHPARNRWFRHVEAQLERLTKNAGPLPRCEVVSEGNENGSKTANLPSRPASLLAISRPQKTRRLYILTVSFEVHCVEDRWWAEIELPRSKPQFHHVLRQISGTDRKP